MTLEFVNGEWIINHQTPVKFKRFKLFFPKFQNGFLKCNNIMDKPTLTGPIPKVFDRLKIKKNRLVSKRNGRPISNSVLKRSEIVCTETGEIVVVLLANKHDEYCEKCMYE